MPNNCFDESPLGVFHMEGEYAIPQGADWDTTITYQENGVTVDFTGYSARMQVRTDYGKAIIAELTTTNNSIVLGTGVGDTPNVILKWTPALTSPLTIYEGIYDLELTSTTGKVLKFLEGRWSLRKEVTV